jgi:glutamate formiminotransferase/formiminotetrahydrofolate cyclodeaminase
MVANLSSHKRGWDDKWEFFSEWSEKGKSVQNRLLLLVNDDTDAFNGILAAAALPKKSEEEKLIRKKAVEEATKNATLVPYKVMETAYEGFEIVKAMVEKGNPNSVTDAGVGALALRACIRGACLNVSINAAGLADKIFAASITEKALKLEALAYEAENEIMKIVDSKIGK